MLSIRQSQMDALQKAHRSSFIAGIRADLRRHLPDKVSQWNDRELDSKIAALFESAAQFGIDSGGDCARVANVAAVYGWDFIDNPGQRWMRNILADPAVSSSSARVGRLVGECKYRAGRDAGNRSLRLQFGLERTAASEPSTVLTAKELPT